DLRLVALAGLGLASAVHLLLPALLALLQQADALAEALDFDAPLVSGLAGAPFAGDGLRLKLQATRLGTQIGGLLAGLAKRLLRRLAGFTGGAPAILVVLPRLGAGRGSRMLARPHRHSLLGLGNVGRDHAGLRHVLGSRGGLDLAGGGLVGVHGLPQPLLLQKLRMLLQVF